MGKITEAGGKVGGEELRNWRRAAWVLWGKGADLSDILSHYLIIPLILLVPNPDKLFVTYKCQYLCGCVRVLPMEWGWNETIFPAPNSSGILQVLDISLLVNKILGPLLEELGGNSLLCGYTKLWHFLKCLLLVAFWFTPEMSWKRPDGSVLFFIRKMGMLKAGI